MPLYGLDTEAIKAYDTVGEISGVFVEHKHTPAFESGRKGA